MSSSTPTKKMITLISSDDAKFEVEESVVSISQTIKNMIEDDCTDNGIPLLNVTGATLAKVIEYCKKHAENSAVPTAPADETEGSSSDAPIAPVAAASNDEELKNWDADFVKVDHAGLFDLILAANYLNIKSLLDLACQTEADTIKNFTPEQIRQRYNIVNDFTPEEEANIRQENAWAFDQ